MAFFKEFLGLNYYIYDPVNIQENIIGYDLDGPFSYGDDLESNNPYITSRVLHEPQFTMVLLNLHRNGPYGYPTWKQIRVSNNHLTRTQRKSNIFTYHHDGFKIFKEPVITDLHKPISLIGDIKTYNDKTGEFQNRSVEIKTSFGNETVFFANKSINEHLDTIAETDDGYESLKDLYLDGGIDNDGSPFDAFNMFVYRQSIYPKEQYVYLDETRGRKYYTNTYWRTKRSDRRQFNVQNGFGAEVPQQSMWPLDARTDFISRNVPEFTPKYIGGPPGVRIYYGSRYDFDIGGKNHDNAAGGPGVLQNRYSSYVNGYFDYHYGTPTRESSVGGIGAFPIPGFTTNLDIGAQLTASAEYSLLHTLKNIFSPINPSGPELARGEWAVQEDTGSFWFSAPTSSLFNGTAAWDAPKQAGKEPFYDSYLDFSKELRVKGKNYTKIPEFNISRHVEFYNENNILSQNLDLFELSGSSKTGQDGLSTSSEEGFYTILSNSDFLKNFHIVKEDHKDFASEKILTLKCKAIKKFLPYKGFYPADRCVDVANQFYKSYKDNISISIIPGEEGNEDAIINSDQFALKPFYTPMISPGVLFNTIKSGVAVDFPIFFRDDVQYERSEGEVGYLNTDRATFDFLDDVGRAGIELDIDGGEYTDIVGIETPNRLHKLGDLNNALLFNTKRNRKFANFDSMFSTRIPFESLVEPEKYLANEELVLQDPHPFAMSQNKIICKWDGGGNKFFKKMSSNFLAEVPEFFLHNQNFKTISSLEEQSPEFGNAISGNYYTMRVKMSKSRNKPNQLISGLDGLPVMPPQDVVDQGDNFSLNEKFTVRETLTMYSRPSAFGFPSAGDGGYKNWGGIVMRAGSTWGYNFPYTPPYYHGDAWCDLIFYADQTKKYTLEEIMSQAREFPYYTRYWNIYFNDALRDLTGYRLDDESNDQDGQSGAYFKGEDWYSPDTEYGSATAEDLEALMKETLRGKYLKYKSSNWANLIKSSSIAQVVGPVATLNGLEGWTWNNPRVEPSSTANGLATWTCPRSIDEWRSVGPQSPFFLNNNAMQLDSSVNLFGKGTIRSVDLDGDDTSKGVEVASADTVQGKTRWIIQTKFETPILNFNKYTNLNENNCTAPKFAKSSVPRGMWHQYGDLPKDNEGIYLQVEDIPQGWLRGALGIPKGSKNVKSLADLVGFSKDPVRLGEVADVKEISEAVVAVPFIEKDGTRKFFSIPREDIESCIGATKREVEPGNIAGGGPKAGDSVYQMVKRMQKYVFPPSMDFVRYKEIDPFAMYIFEFKHNLTKKDLADIWQNLPPEIGTKMEEAEATISHELLAHELLGGGAVVKNGILDENAEGNGIPSNIQWMIFKAKKRAKTNYFDKVVAKKGTTEDTSSQQLENAKGQTGDDPSISYNWPYDFFSLVELVKIDAEVVFANLENDDKGQKSIKKVEKKNPLDISKSRAEARGVDIARGKGKLKK